MTWSSGISGLEGWKKHLKPDEIRQVMGVVSRFGIDVYTDAPEPDYQRLHDPGLTLAKPAIEAA